MVLLALQIPNMKTESDDGGFDMMDHGAFDPINLGYPPSSAHSFSSSDSSSFGPFTPTSGRSTPPNYDSSLQFATSFGSTGDSFAYDLTPPSSAVSSYFQAGVKYEDPCTLYQPTLPVTPSRSQQEFGNHLLSNFGQQTPPQATSYYPFGLELAPSPLPATPVHGSQFSQSWDPWSSTWAQADSPITFGKKEEDSPHSSFATPTHHGRRLFDDPAKEKTTALRKAQLRGSLTSTGAGIRKRTKPAMPSRTKALAHGLDVPIVKGNEFKCDWVGCDKAYQKKEHMVRHRNGAHLGVKVSCEFCGRLFDRTDNLGSHLFLHTQQRASGKVAFVPEAAAKMAAQPPRTRARKSTGTKAVSLEVMGQD
ncbi:hypothetical protein QBC39DRAFT_67520 [Podospora conica]|nr:hypothetical protein QBC39DRAFT_67520 [Schizothecium conicum]